MSEIIAKWLVMVLFVAPCALFLLLFAAGLVASMFAPPGKVRRSSPGDNIGGGF